MGTYIAAHSVCKLGGDLKEIVIRAALRND